MRVIGGSLKGRVFAAPKGTVTKPMSEKMRGAVFSMLGDVQGLSTLDAYCGSGAIAIEALSRGAVDIIALDSSHKAISVLSASLATLGIKDKIKPVHASIKSFVGYW